MAAASLVWLAVCFGPVRGALGAEPASGPFDAQVAQHAAQLEDSSPAVRAWAAEALGFQRAYRAEAALLERLRDAEPSVRRSAVMALAWCGGRAAVTPLIEMLADEDWTVRQSAWVALTNLTGLEFPFDASALAAQRKLQADQWRQWWAGVPADRPPDEVLALLGPRRSRSLAYGAKVTVSTQYKGEPGDLVDGTTEGGAFWQTKNVPFPQSCQLDLGRPQEIAQAVVYQYGPEFCMTDCELAVSLDGEQFDVVTRHQAATPVTWAVRFPARQARYVRIISFGTVRPLYPTTFYEIEVYAPGAEVTLESAPADERAWLEERGARALGALGGNGAAAALLNLLEPEPSAAPRDRVAVRTAIRALGRLRDEAGFQKLLALLDRPLWARNAADALGEFGDRRAVPHLLAAYARYARRVDGTDPPEVPADDRMGFPSEDRMLETPYSIAMALCRLPLDAPEDQQALRALAPQIMANLPSDYDSYVVYEPEVYHRLTWHLVEQTGLRRDAIEYAFERLGQPRAAAAVSDAAPWPVFPARRMATWLPALCGGQHVDASLRDADSGHGVPGPRDDLPRLAALLQHDSGWVRIYAAKALAWIGDRRAIEPLAKTLAESKSEADFGYSGRFKDEEYNDPCPRWREAIVRALGQLGAVEHTPQIVAVLNDERAVLDVRHAAAQALDELGGAAALAALQEAALRHPFLSVRNVARDALERRGVRVDMSQESERPPVGGYGEVGRPAPNVPNAGEAPALGFWPRADFEALIFIQGDNNLPNTLGTVEQADRWRQTYVVTDSGPEYRPGNNLYRLSPPRPDGQVTPLTKFPDGYVASPEVSWDGRQVIFARREQNASWWHVWRIGIDGSGLQQLTFGPYHHVQPAFLADGRIVFGCSRVGIRDEYHGYPCTSLHVMNADGSDIHAIATNIGRDNEPALLPDGRIVFSRLEVFYSRNKTELTLHAVHPDGTMDAVLYGPERRGFWRSLDHGAPGPDDGQEAPLTHRVLRMTQPQPMPDGRQIVVATQGGLTLVGGRRDRETLLMPDFKTRAYTTPLPLADGSILCASTEKTPDREKVDLGLYRFYPGTGQLELIYNDPRTADYEPRPVVARQPPPTQPLLAGRNGYTGRLVCASVYNTQEPEARQRGRWVRLVEGTPVVGRHETHTGPDVVWRNHGGTLARVLGTVPLLPDGSFNVELPADRLVHFQVLDSDRRVVGNQLTWINVRPGEAKSCAGCHEGPHTAPLTPGAQAAMYRPLKLLPDGHEFRYRAKAWFKGSLPGDIEERTRTVHAVNLIAR
jgi:HEAT repeat protein